MKKAKLPPCKHCKPKQAYYRVDYPASKPKAWVLIHAKGCWSKLSDP